MMRSNTANMPSYRMRDSFVSAHVHNVNKMYTLGTRYGAARRNNNVDNGKAATTAIFARDRNDEEK